MKLHTYLSALCLCVPLACSQPAVEPQVASSAGEPAYATRYPEKLGAVRGRFSSQEGESRQKFNGFSSYTGELKDPDWNQVAKVYRAADNAGKSGSYVSRAHENRAVEEFFDDEKEEISKKVAGAAQYAAKQKGCEGGDGVYGSASAALEKSVEKQLEKRMREHNEAHRIIENNADALGKPNREKLETQADDIAYASYLVNVGVVESKVELKRMVEEAEEVNKTLDRTIEEAKADEAGEGRSDTDKKSATARREAAEASKQRIESEVNQANHVLTEMEDRIKALQQEYQKAFDTLMEEVEQKAQSSGTGEAAAS